MKRLILALLLFAACSEKKTVEEKVPEVPVETVDIKAEYQPLYINHLVATPKGKTNNVSAFDNAYLETTLSIFDGEDGSSFYKSERKVQNDFKSQTDYTFAWDKISQADGSDMKFISSTDFLNYMAERGYEMVDKKANGSNTDYTFKKKE